MENVARTKSRVHCDGKVLTHEDCEVTFTTSVRI